MTEIGSPLAGQPPIATKTEAWLCVAWMPIWAVSVLTGIFVNQIGYFGVLLVFVDWFLLLHTVGNRLGVSWRTRFLRFWLGQRMQYHAWRYIAGRLPPSDPSRL